MPNGWPASGEAGPRQTQAARKLEAMVALARSERQIAAEDNEFDGDPWALNVANGTLDLRTRRAARSQSGRSAYQSRRRWPMTRRPSALCGWPFSRIMAGDQELISFLPARRRLQFGRLDSTITRYSFPMERAATARAPFLRTIIAMLGDDYAMQAAPDVLTVSRDRHPTELADFAGKRFVASIEVDEGKRLAEALVKQLTGGDPMKARFMRQDFFQFEPTFKLFLAANHKPVIRGTDWAIWRHVKLIPFTVTIPEAEQDKSLGEKLRAELPGILAWAVAGCLAWQREGLSVPDAVKKATEAYRAESDTLGQFLAECTTIEGANLQAQAGPLFEAYKQWCAANSEHELTRVSFGRQLVDAALTNSRIRIPARCSIWAWVCVRSLRKAAK